MKYKLYIATVTKCFQHVPHYYIPWARAGIKSFQENSEGLACSGLVLCDRGYRGNWSVMANPRVITHIIEMKSASNSTLLKQLSTYNWIAILFSCKSIHGCHSATDRWTLHNNQTVICVICKLVWQSLNIIILYLELFYDLKPLRNFPLLIFLVFQIHQDTCQLLNITLIQKWM